MADHWSEREVTIAVEAYLDMLEMELKGRPYNKSQARQAVLPRLDNRSNGSLEYKNANISAALADMRLLSIDGYKPRWNYQRSVIPKAIWAALDKRPAIFQLMRSRVGARHEPPKVSDVLAILDRDPPEVCHSSPAVHENRAGYNSAHPDYLELEARNRSVGLAGEELVLRYERERLSARGKHRLADQVEHVSSTLGDGAGFDIRSFDLRGRDIFIEVKTTCRRKETPFYITSNEVSFARENAPSYSLYRVYHLQRNPRLFVLPGSPEDHCRLAPTEFRASFGAA